jgi:hypothetical protein
MNYNTWDAKESEEYIRSGCLRLQLSKSAVTNHPYIELY